MLISTITKEYYEDIVSSLLANEFNEDDLDTDYKSIVLNLLVTFADKIETKIFGGDD